MNNPDNNNFHEFALKSNLFKGRADLYFCYLKSEKIAHVIARLLAHSADTVSPIETLTRSSAYLAGAIVRFAAGELEEGEVLADLFELMSMIRITVSYEALEEQTARLLIGEYEGIARKISLGKHASPFVSLEELTVPMFALPEQGRGLTQTQQEPVQKDKQSKGQIVKDKSDYLRDDRSRRILKIILENKRVSIKDISKMIKNCSEKTIQRELASLVRAGLIHKQGQRRWSFYIPGPNIPKDEEF